MKKNILVLGSGGNASRNYVKSLKLDEEGFIGNVIGADIDPNAEFFSNTDKFYLINHKSKIDDIKNIIISEKIDYIHAQPDSEVLFLAENMDLFKNKTTHLNLSSYNKYNIVPRKDVETNIFEYRVESLRCRSSILLFWTNHWDFQGHNH